MLGSKAIKRTRSVVPSNYNRSAAGGSDDEVSDVARGRPLSGDTNVVSRGPVAGDLSGRDKKGVSCGDRQQSTGVGR